MEVSIYNTKGVMIMYPLPLFAIMLILLNGYCCGAAAVLVKTNTTSTFRCDGRLDECLLQDDLELEFLINPYVITRQLLQSSDPPPPSPGNGALTPESAVFKPCPPNYCVATPQNPTPVGCRNVVGCRPGSSH